ncbi:MAG TPA: Gfo/Idh/MocA family oxidoreductase [Candidatus Limnocylindrales bacterium]|nr:Gfo/Idh/MocA family oxidoreductase [Candidatus Limnocylindrales bacterium]
MSKRDSTPGTSSMTRRQFLYYSAVAAGAISLPAYVKASPRVLGAGDKLRIASVGAGGKGRSDIQHCSAEQIVAICDADENMAASALKAIPNAKFYSDWREMLEKEQNNIDAVTVSTPDHLHACVASAAMKLGKHVYCQKPLTQTVYEARYLRRLAKEQGVITQMGNQGSSEDGLRRAVEVVHAGLIGSVQQIHVWTNRPIWPQGIVRPAGQDPVPPNFKWDLWLGPAAQRPFKAGVYHPFKWRGWFEFGTGAMGDMACHTANMPFRAAKLGYPRLVELLDHSELNPDTYPKTAKIRFVFPPREGLPETEFFWYDGNPRDKTCAPLRPSDEVTKDIKELLEKVPDAGCLLIGEKGQIFSPDDYGARFFIKLNDEKEFVNGTTHEGAKAVPVSLPRNTLASDTDAKQHLEWIAACKGGPIPYSNFDIAAYLTEIILLGCVALRVGKKLEWDGPNMKATNAPEAAQFVKRAYRDGFALA